MWGRGLALAGTVTIFLTATSTPVESAIPVADGASARAITVLADPDQSARELRLPADFRAVMGFDVVEEPGPDGRPVPTRSDATCSSPFGETRYGFGQACRVHDLGYDVLRYAARTGQPLGSWARRALDGAFGERLRQRCDVAFTGLDRLGCRTAAAAYQAAVSANSWRQGFAAPAPESVWAVAVPGGLAAAGGLAFAVRRVRRVRRVRWVRRLRLP